jgi:hypothetical protein
MIELKNAKIQYLGKASGRDRYVLDAFIGAVQMRSFPNREGEGQWQDIKPCLIRDADGWHIEGAPYYAEIKDDGTRLFCPDRNERNKYLRLPAPALFSGLAQNVVSNPANLDGTITPNQITMPTDWGEMRIIFGNTGMHFEILFTKAPPLAVFGKDSPRILLDAETAGIDIEQLLKSRSGIGIPRPRLMATSLEAMISESQEKWLEWNYKNGQLELGFDFGDLQFPILLKNTTIDVSVGAGADDGWVRSSNFNTNTEVRAGNWASGGGAYNSWVRFTGITIPQSSTINVAYLTCYDSGSFGTPLTKIYADDQNDPVAPTTAADYNGRTLTSAGVDEDGNPGSGWHNTNSIVSVIQELVNSYDYSNEAIQIMWKNDGSTGDNCRFSLAWDYGDHSKAPAIHIEYTAGGATPKTSAETGTGAEGLVLQAAVYRGETAGGADTRQSLLARLIKNENGTGVEQSLLASLVAKLSIEAGSGIETRSLVARLVSSETGTGADSGMIPGMKSAFGGDGGVGRDALKTLIETSGAGSDMKLPGRQSHVRIPSKGVSL